MNQTTPSALHDDLYDQLRTDTTGERREALLAQLLAMQSTCAAAKQKLSDREAYRLIEASSSAVEAAIRIVKVAAKPS